MGRRFCWSIPESLDLYEWFNPKLVTYLLGALVAAAGLLACYAVHSEEAS